MPFPKLALTHRADLHILVNTVHSPSIINSSASASWLPICLPKFNPSAFVNAYVAFLRRPEDSAPQTPTPSSMHGSVASDTSLSPSPTPDDARSESTAEQEKPPLEIGLICVSGVADFEAVRGWCATASEVRPRPALLCARA